MSILVVNVNPHARTRAGTRRIVAALARLAPSERVVERHFGRLDSIPPTDFSLVVIGPQGVPFDAYPDAAREHLFGLLRGLVAAAAVVGPDGMPSPGGPVVLGICGGHQALALAFGGTLAPVHGGIARGVYDGLRKETGERVVTPVGPDPLAAALPGRFVVSHVEAVTRVPDEFVLVGVGEPCRVQLVRHREKAVWGAQFHPERGADGPAWLRRLLSLRRAPA